MLTVAQEQRHSGRCAELASWRGVEGTPKDREAVAGDLQILSETCARNRWLILSLSVRFRQDLSWLNWKF